MPDNTLKFLDKINSPADLKKLSLDQLIILAEEIRTEIIKVVSKNGGHLASSLGAVELIIALHYVFDTLNEEIIFDVGHQSYAHKLLTGRREQFKTLRQANGLSGFPKRSESVYDFFDAGHASTSISAALGFLVAKDLNNKEGRTIAVIGDGALTGGMAMEALNHTGDLKKKLLVILNDNNMSISKNVGALSSYYSLSQSSKANVDRRNNFKSFITKIMPNKGFKFIKYIRKLERQAKGLISGSSNFFETLGFKYIGPVDGHNLKMLIKAMNNIKNVDQPVLLHISTTKGKGYTPAESDPCYFHGISCQANIQEKQLSGTIKKNYTDIFGDFLLDEAKINPKLVAITAAMSMGTGLQEFFKLYPERAFDVGIAEQHGVTFAAGLAAAGFKPVVAMYSTFLQRSFDQLFHDVALQNLPVMFAIDRSGLVGEDGPTHHGSLDLSYLRILPNFTLMAPKDEYELVDMLKFGLSLNGPSAVRYPRGKITGCAKEPTIALELGKGHLINQGDFATIIAIGSTVLPAIEAANRLSLEGKPVSIINLRFLKPIDKELIIKEGNGKIVLTVEENSLAGGLKSAVSEVLTENSIVTKAFKSLGLPINDPIAAKTQQAQREELNLTAIGIYNEMIDLLNKYN